MMSRLNYKATPATAVAKGSAGETVIGRQLVKLGWDRVVDLARTYPGADILAICGCYEKHLLWAEVKTYPIGQIKPDSWANLTQVALSASQRPREAFALFTYQRANGRPKRGKGPEWWVARYPYFLGNQRPLISAWEALEPPCRSSPTLVSGTPLQGGVSPTRAPPQEG